MKLKLTEQELKELYDIACEATESLPTLFGYEEFKKVSIDKHNIKIKEDKK